MDLTSLKLFKMAETRMAYASERQRVLAQNISNSDTPSYKPQDLKPLDFKQVLRGQMTPPVQVARSSPQHLAGTLAPPDTFNTTSQGKAFEESPDGNDVVVEEQMQKVSDTRASYDAAVTIIQANIKMLSMAVKGNSGS